MTRTLTRDGDRYRVTSVTEPTSLGKLMAPGILREDGTFRLIRGRIRPIHYQQKREGKKSFARSVDFDWNKKVLRFGDGREQALPLGTQDSGSIIFALMLALPPSDKPQVVHLTDGKRLNRYTYSHAGREKLSTPIGDFDTVLVQRANPRKQETVTIWVAPRLSNVPVKLKKERKGKVSSALTITSVKGIKTK